MNWLSGRVALVTGGARRLGRALVEDLAAAGARVALHYNQAEERANEVCDALVRAGADRPTLFRADLTDADAARRLPGRVSNSLGRLDVLINSAAMLVPQPFPDVTPDGWDRVMNLNLRAYFFTVQGAAVALRAARGKVVNVSDVAAFDAWPNFIPHCASKAGVEMLTKGLALVLAPEVTVNGVAPGAVLPPPHWTEEAVKHRADRIPLGRVGDPSDVARAVRFLLESPYATGTTVVVDGGTLAKPRGAW